MTKDQLEKFFQRYERFFMKSLGGEIDGGELAELYAPEFIAASPLYLEAMSSTAKSEQKGCVFEA